MTESRTGVSRSRPRQAPLHQFLVSHLLGGAGLVAVRLSAAAGSRGYRCVAWVPGDGPAREALTRSHVPTRQYNLEALHGNRWRLLGASARITPHLIGLRRPLVHVHGHTFFSMIRPALFAAGARVVVHVQIEPSAHEIEWMLKYPPTHIIACARYIAANIQDAAQRKSLPLSVTAIPNAVDLERFVPGDRLAARTLAGLSTDRFVVLILANLAPHKGQVTALRAIDLLVRRGLPVECWLVGEDRIAGGRYEQELRSLSAELGLADHVRFLGFRDDAPTLMRAADAFVLPSTLEGLPISVLEAQACRVPVVGSNIPGILEVVEDGRTGFIVPADDPAGYADRLQRLRQDDALKAKITDAASAQVSRQNAWSALEDSVFDVYRTMADPGGRDAL